MTSKKDFIEDIEKKKNELEKKSSSFKDDSKHKFVLEEDDS